MIFLQDQKTINQRQQNQQIPIRRSRRLNKDLEPESPIRENVNPPIPKPVKIKKQKPLLQTTLPEATKVNPTTPTTVENFRKYYEDVENPQSFSGDIKAIANQIPSYRFVERVEKLARRLNFY